MVLQQFIIISCSASIRAWLAVVIYITQSTDLANLLRDAFLGHPSIVEEFVLLKKLLLRRDSNRGPMTQLNVALDRAATTAGLVSYLLKKKRKCI
jgi:hypothetical protein